MGVIFPLVYSIQACRLKDNWQLEVKDVSKTQIFQINKGYNSYSDGLIRTINSDLDGLAYLQQWYCNKEDVEYLLSKNFNPNSKNINTGYATKIPAGKTIKLDSSEIYAEIILIRFVPGTAKSGKIFINYKLKNY